MSDSIAQKIILIAPDLEAEALNSLLDAFANKGYVAALLIPERLASFEFVEAVCLHAQSLGIAVLVENHFDLAKRVGADGLHLGIGGSLELIEAAFDAGMMAGVSVKPDRHKALEAGEREPDYILFGALDGDTHPEPYIKALEVAKWWDEMVEIPAVVLAGSDPDQTYIAVQTGAEFIALGRAVFDQDDPVVAFKTVTETLRI